MQAKLTLALALAALATACGHATDAAQLESARKPQDKVFSRDSRPVDGDLAELRIVATAGKKFKVTLRTAFFDRRGGKAVDETKVILDQATCTFAAPITCKRDLRPVDGGLTEVILAPSDDGRFDATVHTAIFDRRAGKELEHTEDLASGLKAAK